MSGLSQVGHQGHSYRRATMQSFMNSAGLRRIQHSRFKPFRCVWRAPQKKADINVFLLFIVEGAVGLNAKWKLFDIFVS